MKNVDKYSKYYGKNSHNSKKVIYFIIFIFLLIIFVFRPFSQDISNIPDIGNIQINTPENIIPVNPVQTKEKNEETNNSENKGENKEKVNKEENEEIIPPEKKVRSWRILLLMLGFFCMVYYKVRNEINNEKGDKEDNPDKDGNNTRNEKDGYILLKNKEDLDY